MTSVLASLLADRPPRDPLLTAGGTVRTAADVLVTTEQLCGILRAVDVAEGGRVAVVLPSGPQLALVCLAAMAGATCAPLDPRSTEEEVRRTLDRLGADLLVVPERPDRRVERAAAVARDLGVGIVTIDDEDHLELVDPPSAHRRRQERTADGPVLLLHSSGTTAEPKLIGLGAHNLAASARSISATLGLGPADRCLNVMPLFHIHGLVGALLSTVVGGGAIECTSGFDAFAHRRRLADPVITWSTAVPSMYQAMLLRGPEDDAEMPSSGRALPLRFLRSSSAPLPGRVWRELEERFGCPVLNAYGMTEASHQMASNPLPPGERRIGTVGTSAGADVAVLVDGSVTQAPDREGEVVVRGSGVIEAYLSPLTANEGAWVDGWFRTGDAGRLDADGYLTLVGRLKEIINVAGEKVSPFEVEAAFLDHPDVAEVVAFAAPDDLRGECVALAVVARGPVSEPDLRRYGAERLTRAKVPARVVQVESIPLGPTGKVQRVRLAAQLGLVPPG